MTFKQHFISRLETLSERETQEFPVEDIPTPYKQAAVLLPFAASAAGGVELIMTKRSETLANHGGQVSFPGGTVDPADESLQAAALREAQEEIGLLPEHVTIMGRLDDAWGRYGHHVIPFVGWLDHRPELTPDPNEVAEVLIADMEILMQPESSRKHEIMLGDVRYMAEAFSWDGGYVWGLSADLLLELILWVKGEPSNRGALRLEKMKKYTI